jgi:hypothetical protein
MSVARHRVRKAARRRAHALRLDNRSEHGRIAVEPALKCGPSLKPMSARKALRRITRAARKMNR